MQRWRHICTNRPPPDHLRATYAQPARRCVPSHARPAMMNVIHVSQRCQRLVGNYVSAGRGFRWHLLGTNPPRTPGPQREPAANSRASARTRRELPGLSAKPPQAPAPRHESAASPPTSARNRRELRRLSTRPPRAVPSEHATDGATPVSCRYGYTPHAGLHIAAGHGLQICSAGTISARTAHRRPHSGRIRAARTSTAGHRPRDHDSRPRSRSRRRRGRGTVDEITIHGPDHDLVGVAAGHRRRDHD